MAVKEVAAADAPAEYFKAFSLKGILIKDGVFVIHGQGKLFETEADYLPSIDMKRDPVSMDDIKPQGCWICHRTSNVCLYCSEK